MTQNGEEAFGDYLISCFRKELGLFFDANDAPLYDKAVHNSGLLLNGQSYFVLRITENPIDWAAYSVVISRADASVRVEGYFLSDSPVGLSAQAFQDIVNDAQRRFNEAEVESSTEHPTISLLSFQLRHQEIELAKAWNWVRYFSDTLGGRYCEIPAHVGPYSKETGFEVLIDPDESWVQIEFPRAVSADAVNLELRKWCDGLNAIEFRHNQRYLPTRDAEAEFGLSVISFLARRF